MTVQERAKQARLEVETDVAARYGSVNVRRAMLLDLYEQTMVCFLVARDDVEKRGMRELFKNGRQQVTRKNPCFDQMTKASASLIRLLNAILPESRRADPPPDDGGDEDEDLDSY